MNQQILFNIILFSAFFIILMMSSLLLLDYTISISLLGSLFSSISMVSIAYMLNDRFKRKIKISLRKFLFPLVFICFAFNMFFTKSIGFSFYEMDFSKIDYSKAIILFLYLISFFIILSTDFIESITEFISSFISDIKSNKQ